MLQIMDQRAFGRKEEGDVSSTPPRRGENGAIRLWRAMGVLLGKTSLVGEGLTQIRSVS